MGKSDAYPHPNVCDEHWNNMLLMFPDPSVVKCTQCRCRVDENILSKYNKFLLAADEAVESTTKMESMINAIVLIDDEPSLHSKILLLGETLGYHAKR